MFAYNLTIFHSPTIFGKSASLLSLNEMVLKVCLP
jgi:hypothetical protein